MGSTEYRTPLDFFGEVHREFQFTIDVASTHENALLPRYCTKEGFFYRGELVSPTDGLNLDWSHRRVWCNPPYNRIGPWVAKALERKAEVAVLLLPNGVDSKWFHSLFPEKDMYMAFPQNKWGEHWLRIRSKAIDVNIMQGRLRFLNASGETAVQPIDGNTLVVVRGR